MVSNLKLLAPFRFSLFCYSGLVVGAVCYTFYIFSPLVYGMSGTEGYARETNSTIHHLHWLSTWEF